MTYPIARRGLCADNTQAVGVNVTPAMIYIALAIFIMPKVIEAVGKIFAEVRRK